MDVYLMFSKEPLCKIDNLLSDETKTANSYHQFWRKNKEFKPENIIPIVKHGYRNAPVQGIFYHIIQDTFTERKNE